MDRKEEYIKKWTEFYGRVLDDERIAEEYQELLEDTAITLYGGLSDEHEEFTDEAMAEFEKLEVVVLKEVEAVAMLRIVLTWLQA